MRSLAGGTLYTYMQSVQAYISPPIAAIFLLGLFWKRLNAAGAMAALWTGFVLGFARIAMEVAKVDTLFATMNFLHFAIALFAVCSVVLIGVSM